MIAPCQLCGKCTRLAASHVFPKFYWRWLRDTGGPYLRTTEEPNRRLQDGYKEHWLCQDCEQRFSRFEDFVARNIFRPLVQSRLSRAQTSITYDNRLYGFAVSLLWRALLLEFETQPERRSKFQAVELAWQAYLNQQDVSLTPMPPLHVIVTGIPVSGGEEASLYFSRGHDWSTVLTRGSEAAAAVYAKLGPLIFWAHVDEESAFRSRNTAIVNGNGQLRFDQVTLDPEFGSFLLERATLQRTLVAGAQQQLSERAIQQITSGKVPLGNGELGRVLRKERLGLMGLSHRATVPRAGRNELCPCGSGAKYKRCHGK